MSMAVAEGVDIGRWVVVDVATEPTVGVRVRIFFGEATIVYLVVHGMGLFPARLDPVLRVGGCFPAARRLT
jgi:hypothetical protein